MVAQHAVEQGLVAVLQRSQIDVLVEIVSPRGELVPAVFDLLVEGLLRGWQQTQQAVSLAFLPGERGALGGQRIEQLRLSPQFLGHGFPSAGSLRGFHASGVNTRETFGYDELPGSSGVRHHSPKGFLADLLMRCKGFARD